MFRAIAITRYYSILLESYPISSGAFESPDLLLSSKAYNNSSITHYHHTHNYNISIFLFSQYSLPEGRADAQYSQVPGLAWAGEASYGENSRGGEDEEEIRGKESASKAGGAGKSFHCLWLYHYISISPLSQSVLSVALNSSTVLLSPPATSLASHINIHYTDIHPLLNVNIVYCICAAKRGAR